MSGIEALVVAFGLFIGYWVVAKLLAGNPKTNPSEWHDTLRVSPHASVAEIENAYRLLMSRHHPDEAALTAAYRRAMQARGASA